MIMFEKVKAILVEQLSVDKDMVTLDARISEDLGADSLDVMELLMTLEDEYGIVIPDEELATFEKVADIVSYIENNM